jgi:hypothetical protein
MDIVVFSDNKTTGRFFTKVGKSKKNAFQLHPCAEFKKILKTVRAGSFVYYDITNRSEEDIKKAVRQLDGLKKIQYGIIDPRGVSQDIAEYFYKGASDYIGKQLVKDQLTEKRLQRVMDFGIEKQQRGAAEEGEPEKTKKPEYILSGSDWKNIKTGIEYTFVIMLIGMDGWSKLKKSYHRDQLDTLLKRLEDYISYVTEPNKGRIWMSMDAVWLLLFPFNGKRCSPFLTCFRLMLDRNIISAEDIGFNIPLSYRISLHIGNTVYKKRGDTGQIVSDTINSVFHLGQKYTEPGGFYVTQEVFPFIPKGLDDYFIPAGVFEGREIRRMRSLR